MGGRELVQAPDQLEALALEEAFQRLLVGGQDGPAEAT